MDDDTYLQPDFDPNTVTIPVLRNILFRNDVELPNTAKKAQLVELFNEHIAPRRAAILDQRSRVRASSHGIVDVDKHGNAVQDDSRRRRTGRRKSVVDGDDGAAAAATVGDEEILDSIIMSPPVRTAPRGPSPAKKVSSRFTRTEDAGPAAPSTSRKSRRSSSRPAPAVPETPAPKQQEEEPDQQAVNGEPEQSPFSSENPFQRGTPVRRSPKENRRKSTPRSGLPTEERQSSRSTRRQTDFISSSTRDHDESSTSTSVITDRRLTGGPYDTLHSSTQRYEIPLSRLRNPSPVRIKQERHDEDDEEDLLRPGEEFTPEEAQEVAEAERESTAVARARRRTVGGEGPGPASMLWVIMGTLLSAYFVWWRKEKIDIGYCGVGMTAPPGFTTTDTSPWTNILRPSCEPCPPNAICKPKYVAVCKDDYVLLHNPLSLGGLIPLPPTCEPDSEKLRRIAILSDEAIKVLRKRAAEVECGEVEPTKVRLQKKKKVVEKGQGGAEGEKEGEVGEGEEEEEEEEEEGPVAQGKGVDESELRRILYELKAPKLSDAQFNELWRSALEDVAGRDEVEVKEDSATGRIILASASLASIPLACSIRLSLLRTLAAYRVPLMSLVVLSLAIAQGYASFERRKKEKVVVGKYVHLVLRTLQRQAQRQGAAGGEEFLPVVQMRDRVLQHEFDPERRKRVWEKVQRVIECNSNVRATSREVRGEVLRCWTWIGGVLEEGESAGAGNGTMVKKEEDLDDGQWWMNRAVAW